MEAARRPGNKFSTTRWTLVRQAGDGDGPESRQALEDLCELYWYPLYAFARRIGHDEDKAANLVQSLFLNLIERDSLKNVGEGSGRFRNYLITALKNLELKQVRDASREKRGGGSGILSLDFKTAEEQFSSDPVDPSSGPDSLLLRDWAYCVIDLAKKSLRLEEENAGRGVLYDALEPFFSTPGTNDAFEVLGSSHGLAPGTVKVRLHRLRKRFGELVRDAVAETLDDPSDIDAEIDCLMEALSG